MPSIEQNKQHWEHYDWRRAGDEWSTAWGGARAQWFGTLLPRLERFLPSRSVLEIACGFGRWTQFLLPHAERLVAFDLAPACVEACRQRFAAFPQFRCEQTDGVSLPGVADDTIDLAFSFDSLVHAEIDVVAAYLRELGRVLRPGGFAFLHHSNLGQFVDAGRLQIPNLHWRAESVSADAVERITRGEGLACVVQEIVNWGGEDLIDCLSLVHKPREGNQDDTPMGSGRSENRDFMHEAMLVAAIAKRWEAVTRWKQARST